MALVALSPRNDRLERLTGSKTNRFFSDTARDQKYAAYLGWKLGAVIVKEHAVRADPDARRRGNAERIDALTTAVALYAVSVALAAARWRLLLNAMAGPVRLVDVVLANLGGICANNLTISSRLAGEAARIALIRVRSRVPVPEATAAVVLERLSELPPIAILIVLAFPALAVVNGGTMLVMGIALTALVAIIALTTPRWNQPLRAWWARRFGRDRTLLVPRATMMAAVGWSSLVWLQDVMRLWLVARALRVGLTIPQAATLSLLTMVAGWALLPVRAAHRKPRPPKRSTP
jgi:uncharacterized membrane protein YbhN (UPF0104 family)